MTMPADRERDRRSLQDLAKLAQGGLGSGSLTPPPPASMPPSMPSSGGGLGSGPASMPAPAPSMSGGVLRGAEGKADDSGVVDLAAVSQADPGGAARAQTTPLANAGLFDDEPASVRPGAVSMAPASGAAPASLPSGRVSAPPSSQQLQQPAPTMPPVSIVPASGAPISSQASVAPASAAPASVATATAAPASAEKKKGKGGVVIAILAIGAVAAGGFFAFKGWQAKKAAELAAAMTAAQPATTVAAVTPAPETKPAEAAPADPTPAPEATLDPNALPAASNKLAAKGAPAGKPGALALNTPAPAPDKKVDPSKVSEKDIPTAPTGPGGDLGDAMKKAAGDKDKGEATPAAGAGGPAFAAGTVPQKPSQGAVTGALGSVMGAARACLGPDDPISRAIVTFGSSGTVQSVSVSGGAAGKPAEACIKGALQGAKVAPFAEATYAAPVTIRHN